MSAPIIPSPQLRRTPSAESTGAVSEPANVRPPAELTNAEPTTVAERINDFLNVVGDGPVTTFLSSAVKGAIGAPATRLAARAAGYAAGAHTGTSQYADDFEDFLTIASQTYTNRAGSNAGRMVGSFVPEMLAYSVVASGAAALGARAVPLLTNSAKITKYFAALDNPLLAGVAKPGVVRAAEILGTATGSGALGAAEAATTGDEDPVTAGLRTALLAGGVETGITLLGKAFSRGAREVDKQAIAAAWETSPTKKYLTDVVGDFRRKLIRQSDRVGKAMQLEAVEKQLQGMVPLFVPNAGAAKAYARAQREGLAEAVGRRVNAVRKLHQASGALQVARSHANVTEREILAGAFLSGRPTNFDSTFGSLRGVWRRAAGTPDAIRKELGVAGEHAIRAVDNAVLLGFARGNSSLEMLRRSRDTVRTMIGKKHANEVLLDFEDGGEALVRANLNRLGYSAHTVNKVMEQVGLVTNGMTQLHTIVERMGGEPAIDAARMGVSNYVHHLIRRGKLSDKQFIASMQRHLVKKGFSQEEATRRAIDVIEARKARGFQRFGSIDDRRMIPGTIREKAANGLPIETDPWKATAQYYIGMHQRIALSQVLGFKNEMLPRLTHAVTTEAGPGAGALFRSTIESIAGLKYYNRLAEQFSQSVTNVEAAAKMGLSFVPNAFQFAMNNPLVFGMRNTFKGIAEMGSKHAPKDLKRALGFMATDFFDLGLRANMMGDMAEGVTAKLARLTLKGTLFNPTEQFNRGSAAFGAHAALTDTLAKAAAGRLRGERLTYARKLFEEAGLDLSTVLKQGITDEQYITGVMRLMRRTQFSAGEGTRAVRPVAWQHPLVRIITQFGTFTLNQGRLMRDFVFNEIARGNKKQLARFLGIYMPMAEVSVAVQDAVREASGARPIERPDNPIIRTLDTLLTAGSFGMANTMLWATKAGKLEKLLGPAMTDVFTYGNALVDGRFDEIGSRIRSLPSVRYFNTLLRAGHQGGEWLADMSQKYVDAEDAEEAEAESPAPRDQLTIQDFRPIPSPKMRR